MFVRDLYVEAARDTEEPARDYHLNSAFLSGNQWIFWDPSIEEPRDLADDGRVRMVVNRMAANHRTLVSNLTQRPMTFEVRPNGADDASLHASHIATEILYHLHEDHNWERVRESAAVAILKGGTGAIALDWDEDREDSVETPLTIAEFTVEPGARNPEYARWWIKAQLLSPKEVQAIYDLDEEPRADATNGLNPLQKSMLAEHLGRDDVNALTLVLTYYERPNSQNPEGRCTVEVNDEILQDQEWPFPFTDRLNFVSGVETVIENRWFGETIYTQARSPQVALNMAKSNLSEHLRDASVARMLVPHSAITLMDNFNDVPGNMYPYPDGLEKPNWMNPAQLPAWLQRLPDEWKADIDDLMGVHDASRGVAPGRIESGSGVAILVEQDTTPVGRVIKELAGMFTRLSRMALELHEAETKTTRPAVIDMGDGPLAIDWRGADINGQYNATVPLDSVVPRSRAAQEAQAVKLLEMGLIDNVVDFMKYSEHPGRRDIIQQMEPDVAKAAREHAQMAKGIEVLPAVFDDHASHITEHNKFRKSVAYEQMSDAERELVDLHVQAHETMGAEDVAKMASRAAADPAAALIPDANGAAPLPPEAMPAPLPPDMPLLPGGMPPGPGPADQIGATVDSLTAML